MSKELEELREAIKDFKSVSEALSFVKQWSSKYIDPLREKIASASNEEKRNLGIAINKFKKESDEIFQEFKNSLEKKSLEISPLDLSIDNFQLSNFSFNPLSEVKKDLINLFNSLNFSIESGKEVVTVKENFDDLCIPIDHPSRSESETFYVGDNLILRPHCTPNSIDFLKRNSRQEAKCVTIGCVYRRDDESARHTHQFSQLDFVWISKNLNVGNLKWLLRTICDSLFGSNQEYRFRNSYFPFTQPSFELDMRCGCRGDKGDKCLICKGSGWIEILGAGMLRDEILKSAGYGDEYEGLAGGLGLERIALIKYGISDIRYIYENNFLFLKHDY